MSSLKSRHAAPFISSLSSPSNSVPLSSENGPVYEEPPQVQSAESVRQLNYLMISVGKRSIPIGRHWTMETVDSASRRPGERRATWAGGGSRRDGQPAGYNYDYIYIESVNGRALWSKDRPGVTGHCVSVRGDRHTPTNESVLITTIRGIVYVPCDVYPGTLIARKCRLQSGSSCICSWVTTSMARIENK